MAPQWESDDISIVVVPNADFADSLRGVIAEWVAAGILKQFVVVSSSGYESRSPRPPALEAQLWSSAGGGEVESAEINLFQELASKEWQTVRLIAIQPVSERFGFSPTRDQLLNDVATHVANVLPLTGLGANMQRKSMAFVKINLVVSTSFSGVDVDPGLFSANWDFNVIASPEDRTSPWSPDAFVEDDSKFPAFSMLHVGNIGALWSGMQVGPFDDVEQAGGVTGKIYVERSFVGAIVADSLARRVAARTLRTIGASTDALFDARLGVSIPGTQIIPPSEEAAYRDWVVQHIFALDDAFLQYRNSPQAGEPPKYRWFELQQLVHFLKFGFDKLISIPGWMWQSARKKVGARMTKRFHGDDGLVQVGLDQNESLDRRDRIVLKTIERAVEDEKKAREALNAPIALGDNTELSKPGLWGGIRRLLFGLVDGSDLEDFGISATNGPVPVFASAKSLLQDPDDAWVAPEAISSLLTTAKVQAFDRPSQQSLRTELDELVANLSVEIEDGSKKKDEIEREIQSLKESE